MFPPGIYYRATNVDTPEAVLTRVEGPLPTRIVMPPVGYDIRGETLINVVDDQVQLTRLDGATRMRRIPGLFHMARPSLSPDAKRVVVQATTKPMPAGQPPDELDVVVIDVDAATWAAIPHGPPGNNESPRWFPSGERIAYSSFSPTLGVNLHVYDLARSKEVLVVQDAGALQIGISPDGARVLDMWRFRIWDLTRGGLVADLREKVTAQMRALGYAEDTVHDGQDGRGSFFLDGQFSPDGAHIVFDGAVVKDGRPGLVVFTCTATGDGVRAVTDLVQADPDHWNNYNFSPLNPVWR